MAVPRTVALGAKRALGTLAAFDPRGPLELGLLGRTMLHAIAVGVVAGLIGALFVLGVEVFQGVLIEALAGVHLLRAEGEMAPLFQPAAEFRWWLLLVLPVIGGLACGAFTIFAPEARGGGTDFTISHFHGSGVVRSRNIWVKSIASMITLGSAGGGGRLGPTILIGASIGSTVSSFLRTTARERRILLLAGVAAGISAVFRTPLGAALIAVEIVYRDGFESEALIPAVLASVVSYSIVTSIFGETKLFGQTPRYPFIPSHLPLYVLLGVVCAWMGSLVIASFELVRKWSAKIPVAVWVRPAFGGLGTALVITPLIYFLGPAMGAPAALGLGVVGSGFGGVQMAIIGAPWLDLGWVTALFFLTLSFAKMITAASTIGTGGSAGDFAPSIIVGALLGRAFGLAAALLIKDPRIDPGAFAFVGMGALYGGVAHVPLASLVMVCELAGSYDLLVPLMAAEAVAFIALRKKTLYPAQVQTVRDSPVHKRQFVFELMAKATVEQAMEQIPNAISFAPSTRLEEMIARSADADPQQDVFPVLDDGGVLKGLIPVADLRMFAGDEQLRSSTASTLMRQPICLRMGDTLFEAQRLMLAHELDGIPVVDASKKIVGFVDQSSVARVYVERATDG